MVMVFCRFCCCCSVSQTRPSQFSPEGTQGNTNQPWRRISVIFYITFQCQQNSETIATGWKHSPVGFLRPIMHRWPLLAAAGLHNRGKSGAPVEIARVICVILHSPVPHPVITQLSPFSLAAVDGVEARNAETGFCFKKMAPIYFVYNRGPSLELHVRFLWSFEDIPGLLSNGCHLLLK